MKIRSTWKASQIGKRLLSSVICLSMFVTLVPNAYAASGKETASTRIEEIRSDEITITQEQSDALMQNLFGNEITAVESSNGNYTYQLTQEGSDLLVGKMLGDADPSDQADAGAEDGNALPEGYVDDSNEVLYDMIAELSSKPYMMAKTGSDAPKVDLFFVIDSTGSMADTISDVKENVAEFARYMGEKGITLRIGLIDYKDITVDGSDSTIVHEVDYTPWLSVPDFISELTEVSATGGGDADETPIDALGHLTKDTMGWSSDAYKFAMLITDVGYKTDNSHGIVDMNDLIQRLQADDIQVSVVTGSSYMDDYGDLAGYTGGIQADLYSDFGSLLQEYADAVIGSTQPMKDYTLVVKEQTTGLPVSGATVTWRGGSTTTNASGVAVIQARSNVIENLRIECAGYRDNNIGTFEIGESGKGEITLTVDGTAEDSTGGIPVVTEGMFKDPGKASDTLSGPSIEILGKRFDLLSLAIEIDLGLFDNISISHDPDEKTYSVMIGQKYEGEDPQDDPYWKEDYKKYKSLVQTFSDKSAKDIYNEFRTLRKNNKTKADLVFPVDINVGGYADFSYAAGTLQPTEGGVVIVVSTKDIILVDAPFPPAPYVFFRLTFSADAKGNFSLVTIDSTGKAAVGVTMKSIELTPALTGTLNLGVPKLASIGGGVKGSLGVELDGLPPKELEEILTIDANLALVFSLKLFGFKFGDEWDWASFQLYPSSKAKAMTLAEIGMDDFQPILPKDRPSLMAASLPFNDLEFTAPVYEDAAPQIVPYDGGYMMVWIDTETGRAATDHMALYYSIYNGTGWSAPQIIADDDTGDFAPSVVVKSDGTPVVTWQNAKGGSGVTDLDDRLANLEICVASYSEGSWATQTISNTEDKAPLAVQAVANGDAVSVYWLENSANNPFLAEGTTTSIYKVSSDTGLAAAAEPLASNIEGLSAFAAGSIDGEESYAYVCSDDLYVNGHRYSIGSECHSLQVVDGTLYWSDSEGFNSFDGSRIVVEGDSIPSGFTVLSNGEGRVVLMNQLAEDNGSILYASTDSGSEWSNFAPIADYSATILTTSAALDEEGSILLATGQASDVTQDSEAGWLVVDTYTPKVDVIVAEDAYVSALQAAPGETVQVMVNLTNNGLQAADNLTAKIEGTEYELMVAADTDPEDDSRLTTLGNGESVTAYVSYTLPEDLSSGCRISVGIYSDGEELGTATAIVSGAADLEVRDTAVTRNPDGTATVTATVANHGGITATAPMVTLSQESVAVVETLNTSNTQTLSDLPVNASQTVSFNVGSEFLDATSAYDYKRFTVSAVTTTTEWLVADNQDSALLAPLPVDAVTADEESLALETGTTYELGYTVSPAGAATTISFMSSNTSVAAVSSDGVITPLKAGTATITVLAVESGKSDEVTVTVEGDTITGVNGVSISPESATLKIGESTTLTATISPETALNQNVTWETSADEILSITADGKTVTVTALAAGEGTVTVVTEDGKYTDQVTITVSDTVVDPEEPERPDRPDSPEAPQYTISVFSSFAGGSVSVQPKHAQNGRIITITVIPDDGYELDLLTVIDAKGNELEITNEGGGKYTFTMPGSKVTVEASFKAVTPDNPFTDVSEDSYYYDAVLWAVDKGVTAGTSATTFTPDDICTRAQAVTFLWRAAGSPAPKSNAMPFTDILAGSYYYDAVLWAVEQGITDGTSYTTFSPDVNCSRAQIVTFLYRVAGSPAVNGSATFTDVVSDAYYAAAVKWAEKSGITGGIGGGLFGSNNDCTRAQIVTFIWRYLEK